MTIKTSASTKMATIILLLILTFIFIFAFYLFCKYLVNGEIEQTLLLPTNKKSCICNQIAPLWMLYIMTLTYIFKVTNLKNGES